MNHVKSKNLDGTDTTINRDAVYNGLVNIVIDDKTVEIPLMLLFGSLIDLWGEFGEADLPVILMLKEAKDRGITIQKLQKAAGRILVEKLKGSDHDS